jgi:hypothetical protein
MKEYNLIQWNQQIKNQFNEMINLLVINHLIEM